VTKVDDYRRLLRKLPKGDWADFLSENSGLPGPRGNLELIHAVGEEGSERVVRSLEASDDEYLKSAMEKWLASDDRDVAWLMKQNLKKARLTRMDAEWVAIQQASLA